MSLSNTSLSNSTTINQAITETSADDEALSIVSYIGCGISIICLLATIIIILLFRLVVMTSVLMLFGAITIANSTG